METVPPTNQGGRRVWSLRLSKEALDQLRAAGSSGNLSIDVKSLTSMFLRGGGAPLAIVPGKAQDSMDSLCRGSGAGRVGVGRVSHRLAIRREKLSDVDVTRAQLRAEAMKPKRQTMEIRAGDEGLEKRRTGQRGEAASLRSIRHPTTRQASRPTSHAPTSAAPKGSSDRASLMHILAGNGKNGMDFTPLRELSGLERDMCQGTLLEVADFDPRDKVWRLKREEWRHINPEWRRWDKAQRRAALEMLRRALVSLGAPEDEPLLEKARSIEKQMQEATIALADASAVPSPGLAPGAIAPGATLPKVAKRARKGAMGELSAKRAATAKETARLKRIAAEKEAAEKGPAETGPVKKRARGKGTPVRETSAPPSVTTTFDGEEAVVVKEPKPVGTTSLAKKVVRGKSKMISRLEASEAPSTDRGTESDGGESAMEARRREEVRGVIPTFSGAPIAAPAPVPSPTPMIPPISRSITPTPKPRPSSGNVSLHPPPPPPSARAERRDHPTPPRGKVLRTGISGTDAPARHTSEKVTSRKRPESNLSIGNGARGTDESEGSTSPPGQADRVYGERKNGVPLPPVRNGEKDWPEYDEGLTDPRTLGHHGARWMGKEIQVRLWEYHEAHRRVLMRLQSIPRDLAAEGVDEASGEGLERLLDPTAIWDWRRTQALKTWLEQAMTIQPSSQ